MGNCTMKRVEDLKKQLDTLPPSMLAEVESFIRNLKREAKKTRKPHSLLSDLAEYAIEDDLPTDLAEHHDHYLYGVPKK
jgi:DNA replication initiation complex subunit (GINS family)